MKQLKYVIAFASALMLATVAGCASTDNSASTGQQIDDSVITAKVKTAIFNEPTLKTTEIAVETYKGSVQLSGFVSTQDNITRAAELARNVQGVTTVKNDMRLK
jgi:osmotically-inducible protein OsmY